VHPFCWALALSIPFAVLDVMGCDTYPLSKEQSQTISEDATQTLPAGR